MTGAGDLLTQIEHVNRITSKLVCVVIRGESLSLAFNVRMERKTGLGPAAACLEGRYSTIELLPRRVFCFCVPAFSAGSKSNFECRALLALTYFYKNYKYRDDTIRTCDPFVPSEVRYQAAPHPDPFVESDAHFVLPLVRNDI